MDERVKRLNDSRVVKRWIVVAGVLGVLVFTAVTCLGTDQAKAAVAREPGTSRFTVVLPEVAGPMTLAQAGQVCYRWEFGPYRNPPSGDLNYSYGLDDVLCTNAAKTKWVAVQTYSAYYAVGHNWYLDSRDKYRSALGYSTLDQRTEWVFAFDFYLTTIHRPQSLRCTFVARTHTAECTRDYS